MFDGEECFAVQCDAPGLCCILPWLTYAGNIYKYASGIP
jgi:hypothetical protein